MIWSYWNQDSYALNEKIHYRLFPSSRFLITLLCFGAAFLMMANFSSMNFAITCMVEPLNDTGVEVGNCSLNGSEHQSHSYGGNLPWSRRHQSIVLAGNAIGSVATVFIAGYFTDKYGARYIGLIASVLFTITALLIPITAKHSWWLVLVVRIVQGVGAMASWPLFLMLSSQWYPISERGLLTALGSSGMQVGNIFANIFASYTCSSKYGWPLYFYVLGVIDAVFLILWAIFYCDDVNKCWHVSDSEVNYILQTRKFTDRRRNQPIEKIGLTTRQVNSKTPWFSILTSLVIWSIIAIFFGLWYVFYFIADYVPTYYKEVLDIDLATSGYLSSLPSIFQFVGRVTAGPMGDFLDKRLGCTASIKIMSAIAGYGSGIFILASTAFGCSNKFGAIACICVAYCVFGYTVSGYVRAAMLVSPGFVGTITGIMQTSNFAAALVVPYISGEIIGKGSLHQWHVSFYVAGAIALICTTMFLLFGTGEQQSWATPSETSQTMTMKETKQSEKY